MAMAILMTIYLLNSYQYPLRAIDLYETPIRDSGLPARLERAERVYSKAVGERKEMIRKFGPTPRDIQMYVDHPISDFDLNSAFLSGSRKIRNHGHRIPFVSAQLFSCIIGLRQFKPGSFFPPSFQCPHEVERIGSLGDGGKWTCGLSRLQHKPDCLVYSFGESNGSRLDTPSGTRMFNRHEL